VIRPTTTEELSKRLDAVRTHASKLAALAERMPGQFDATTAQRLVDAIVEVGERNGSMADEQRALLRGAIDYLILIEDAEHDLSAKGFDDDKS
jgi:hypothetical protein